MEIHNSRKKNNSVNGVKPTGVNSSLGRDSHMPQVRLDRHPATDGINNKSTVKIATWNVRTLYQSGKLENIKQEMTRLQINILGLCETRWTDAGCFQSDDFKIIFSGGSKHEKGVGLIVDKKISKSILGYWTISDRLMLMKLKGHPFNISIIQVYAPTSESDEEEIDKFYDMLDKAKGQCKSQEVVIIMGDLNAKVGSGKYGDVAGKYGLGIRNERGQRWVEWCDANNQVITNTWFEDHPRRRWTWRSPGGNFRNQIDYITINKRFRNAIKYSKSYPGADCGSDHNPVICKIAIKLRKLKKAQQAPKLQYNSLQKDQDIRNQYSIAVRNRFEVLKNEECKSTWDCFKESIVTTAEEIVPKKEKQSKNKWMTGEILYLMQTRQKVANKESTEYKNVDKQIKNKCKQAKETWINEECEEIERLERTNTALMHEKIKSISGRKTCTSSGCIQSKDGTLIMEKDEILERWSEYIEELFDDERGQKPVIRKNIEGPRILKAEVTAAIAHTKRNKAAGPDGIVVEMIEALEDFGIDTMTEIINEIYDSGTIPEDLSKSIFIALPKKHNATECELHRTISLMSHVIKMILRIIMWRARKNIKPEIGKEQCGFMKDTGTRNAIFTLRMICERSIEMQKDIYLCFIDYTKAFDKVKHVQLLDMLQDLDIDGKDIRLLRNLYWEQTAGIRIEDKISTYTQIKRGVRQGCVLSPDLFNLYSEQILREIKDLKGLVIGGYNMNNLRYADDTVLISDSRDQLQEILDKVVEESAKRGLSINCKKTECMVVSKKLDVPDCQLTVGEREIKQVEKFSYLGSLITSDGRSDSEIKKRIGMSKAIFEKMGKILKNRKLSMKTKLRVLDCYIFSTLTYGSECWTISQTMEKRLQSVEMWFYRRMLRISWTDHMSNEEVLAKAGTRRKLVVTIRKRQLQFLGHVLRKEELEDVAITGKIEGKRARGRQRLTFISSLSHWMKINEKDIIRTAKDRDLWRTMAANVLEE